LTDTLAIIYHGEESKKAGEPQNARETVNENATSLCNITTPSHLPPAVRQAHPRGKVHKNQKREEQEEKKKKT
jgi:hypothetical protein